MSATQLLAALEALPHTILVVDGAHRIVLANAALLRTFGLTPRDFPPGTPVERLVRFLAYGGFYGPGDPDVQLREVMALRRDVPSRRRVHFADRSRSFDLTSVPVGDGGFVTCGVDVTDLLRAEGEARGRLRLLEGALGRMRTGIAVFDADLRLGLFNPAYAALLGLTGELRTGLTHREIIAILDSRGDYVNGPPAARVAEVMVEELQRGGIRTRERPNGEVLRFESQPLPDGGSQIEVEDVTALRRAEDEARRRAALLHGVLDSLPVGVCVYGPDRRVTLVNEAHHRIMLGSKLSVGERLEDIVARRLAEGEYGPEVARTVFALHEDPDARPIQPRRVRPNGTVMESRIAALPNGGRVVVLTDVTALHRAEEEARRRAEVLGVMLDNMRHGIALFDRDMRVVAANAMAARLTGLDPADLRPGRPLADIQEQQRAQGEYGTPESEKAWRPVAFVPGQVREETYQRERPDGTIIEVQTARTPDGGFVRTYSDITGLRRTEEEARRRAAMLQVMTDNVRHGIALYGPDRRLLLANAYSGHITGIPPELHRRQPTVDELLAEQVRRGAMEPDWAARLSALDRSLPFRYERPTPEGRILEVSSNPTPDGGFVLTFTDVTEDRRIRAELEAARAAAEAASQAKSRFLAAMSHELRTPLNAVIGFAEALGFATDPARARDYADAIREAGGHLLQMVDDVLDVARSQTGLLSVADQPVDTGALLREALAEASPMAEAAELALEAEIPPSLPALRGDARRLERLLRILLSNALKFTPAGGRVCLAAEATPDGLTIRVADTGIGIPPEARETVFEPFTQLDASLARRYQGSGLGLHLGRIIAAAMGATLELEDPDGPGTVAVLRFPPERLLPI
jgi:signal transduction histidine kinase